MKSIKKLPKWWYIKNDHKEIREWFAEKYGVKEIKTQWESYPFIGYVEDCSNNGVLGASEKYFKEYQPDAQLITFEQFEILVLNKQPIYEIY